MTLKSFTPQVGSQMAAEVYDHSYEFVRVR